MELGMDRRPQRSVGRSLVAVMVFATAVIAGACGGEEAVQVPAAVQGQVTALGSAEGRALIDAGGALVIDVRPVQEYTSGHLVGAQSIPVEDDELWRTRTAPLDRDRPTVVYGASADGSAAAAQRLVDAGFTKIYDLGGVEDWDPEDLRVGA